MKLQSTAGFMPNLCEYLAETHGTSRKLKKKISGLTEIFFTPNSSKCIKNVPELWYVGMP